MAPMASAHGSASLRRRGEAISGSTAAMWLGVNGIGPRFSP
jgi:hypothetical protein